MHQSTRFNIIKDIIESITKLENYEEFSIDKLNNTVLYTLKIISLCSVITSLLCTIFISFSIKNISNEIKQNIYSLEYENGILSINDDNLIKINYSKFIDFNLIINTSLNSIEVIDSLDELSKQENCIIVLKDKCILKNEIFKEKREIYYKELQEKGIIINKDYIISIFNELNLFFISLVIFVLLFFITIIVYGINFIVYVLIFTFIGMITSIILKNQLKLKEMYNIVTHSLTLPSFLYTIYICINIFTEFDIKYFQIMYFGITYIYIITAILMIKIDLIKRKIELKKIEEEQEKIKKEFNNNLDDKNKK